jgi:hypothetical protein
MTVTVPLFVLNQVSDERCEWLVPGMLKDKMQALLKSLPQRPRAPGAAAGVRRLVALQLKEPLKYLERTSRTCRSMAVAYMSLGTPKSCASRSSTVALDRPSWPTRCPGRAAASRRIDRRARAAEPDRAGGGAPGRRGAAGVRRRRSASSRTRGRAKEVADDVQAQLQRLVPKRFVA